MLSKWIKASSDIKALSKEICKIQKNTKYQELELESQLLVLFKKVYQTDHKITKK